MKVKCKCGKLLFNATKKPYGNWVCSKCYHKANGDSKNRFYKKMMELSARFRKRMSI